MKTEQYIKLATEKLSKLNEQGLIEVVESLKDKYDTVSGIIQDTALELLMNIMPEYKFIQFCESL